MIPDLSKRLAKKKGGVMVMLQNTTDLPIAIFSGSLTKGKVEKTTPLPNLIAPLSQCDIGFYAPEGQWSFGVQGDSAFKTRLTLLHSAEHANLERLPSECTWTADLQQNWKNDVPTIIITFTIRESNAPTAAGGTSKAPSSPQKCVKR
jgi:hypothetical protein